MGCWMFVSNGKSGMRSHAGAWERGREEYSMNTKKLGGESASNKEGIIRVNDLADYVKTNVHTISRRFGANLAQTPVVKGRRGKEDLVILGKMQ